MTTHFVSMLNGNDLWLSRSSASPATPRRSTVASAAFWLRAEPGDLLQGQAHAVQPRQADAHLFDALLTLLAHLVEAVVDQWLIDSVNQAQHKVKFAGGGVLMR
ncbi:hypothetical protein [Pseudomonas sp. RT6P73]